MELVLIRGLPGSGKSTLAKSMTGHEHYEADQFFMRDGEYVFDVQKLPDAHGWCVSMARDAMRRGVNCVVSNTFCSLWEMKPYMEAAKDAGYEVRVIEAKGQWPSVHNVPAGVIGRMRARWQPFRGAAA